MNFQKRKVSSFGFILMICIQQFVTNKLQNYRQLPRAVLQKEQCGKVRGSSVMRTHDGYDAWDSYERAEDAMG